MKRLVIDILLLAGVLYLPWWIVLVGAVIFAFIFYRYVELIVVGLLIDLLYGQGATLLFPFATTVGTVVVFSIIAFLKTKLRIYE